MPGSGIDFSELANDREISIVTHNMPDPDAISSAVGIHHYLKGHGYKISGIYYSGEVSHPQNKTMMNILNINMLNLDEIPLPKGSRIVLVDTNNVGEGSNQISVKPDEVEILAIFDHHRSKHPKEAKVDYRPVGATASIIWDYLQKSSYDFGTEEGKILATALTVGIVTDTDYLMSDATTELDFQAYQSVVRASDKQKLSQIMRFPLPSYLFELRQTAFLDENKRTDEGMLVSGLGIISAEQRDAVPIIADEFLRMSGITTSIVFAIVDDYLDISVRSKDVTIDVGAFVQKTFGAGGGKQGAGRARIDLGFFRTKNDEDIGADVWDVAKKIVFNRTIGKDTPEKVPAR